MQHWPNVQAKTIKEIAPGTCCAFALRRQTYIAIAIEPTSGSAPDLVALSPGHPQLEGQPGILNASVVQGQSLLVFPDAQIILPTSQEHIRIGFDSFDAPLGALFVDGDRLGLAASDGQETLMFNVADGSVIDGSHSRKVWFSDWQIAVPGPNGERHTLCRVTVKGSGQ